MLLNYQIIQMKLENNSEAFYHIYKHFQKLKRTLLSLSVLYSQH
jgi:hypothetical protein